MEVLGSVNCFYLDKSMSQFIATRISEIQIEDTL